jgi:hypothetical protein
MGTSQLVIGQKIWIQSGDLFKEATVSAIAEDYVEVEPHVVNERGYAIRFDRSGERQLGTIGYVDAWDPRPFCGSSGEPWELVDS